MRALVWRIGLMAATAMALACGTPPEAKQASAPSTSKDEIALSADQQRGGGIVVEPASRAEQPETIRVAGHIAFADDHTWRVGIRTSGVVAAVLVGVGDHVAKGQVLARYHADELRDARAQYRGAQAQLAAAEAGESLAARNRDRAERLLALKAASTVQVEQARQDLVAAQAATSGARAEVDRLRGLLEDDLHVAATPAADDAAADQVPIVAPASGYVVERNLTLGRAIDPRDDTFVIGDLSEVWMLASARQDRVETIHVDQPVRVTVNGIGDATFGGRITNIGQQLDPATRTIAVRIVLKNPGGVLRSGMLGTADIPVGAARSTVAVPSDALQQVNGEDVVFVRVAPDRFAVRTVHAGRTVDGRTPVIEGLKAGEPVVVRGSFVLKSQLLRASLAGE